MFPDALRGGEAGEGFEHYINVKKTADVYLTRTDLDWLIVRPGTLLDTPGAGLVTAGPPSSTAMYTATTSPHSLPAAVSMRQYAWARVVRGTRSEWRVWGLRSRRP